MARVVFDKVSKVFIGPKKELVQAVQDLSLTVADGELLVLLGPSGSGKTTSLRLLAGLERATSGSIAIDGQIVNHLEPKQREIAMVFQHYALYPHLTAFENIAFGLKLRKMPPAEIDRRVRGAAAAVGLTALLDRLPQALSGGERQRVAVGRALVRQPRVFLFDEPLANLDARLRLQMRIELKRLQASLGATTLYVTHDQVEAMTMGQRLAVMNDGRIQQVGAPLEIYHQPTNLFVAGFVGSPPMNFVRGVIQTSGGRLRFCPTPDGASTEATDSGWRLGAAHQSRLAAQIGKTVVLGFRPEAVAPVGSTEIRPDGPELRLVAQVVEPLGGDCFVHGLLGGVAAVARWPSGGLPVPGQALAVWLDFAHAHYFDPATGLALR